MIFMYFDPLIHFTRILVALVKELIFVHDISSLVDSYSKVVLDTFSMSSLS